MSHKPRNQGSNYSSDRRRGNSAFRKRYRVTDKTKRLGITTTETVREIECDKPISEINEEKKTSLGVDFGNQVGNIGFSGAKEDKKTIKFPKSTDYLPKSSPSIVN